MTPVTTGLVVAVLLDLLIGDPNYPLHPVRLIGRLIAATERRLRTIKCLGIGGGVMLVLTVCTTVLGAYTGIRLLLTTSHPAMAWTFDAYCIYSCIALHDMLRHATPIAWALKENDLELARRKLKWIVGRDVTVLDAPAVARAAVESIAESLVDGFLAPLFWMTMAALTAHAWSLPVLPSAVAATLVYRCINTLDSMVGYRNERYMFFGRAAARFDDLLNFIRRDIELFGNFLQRIKHSAHSKRFSCQAQPVGTVNN
jgi:adenosylcobinamide-phosphate synthase